MLQVSAARWFPTEMQVSEISVVHETTELEWDFLSGCFIGKTAGVLYGSCRRLYVEMFGS